MPAAGTECIDYTPAKIIYAATGSLKAASDQTGIGYSAVRVAAHRQDWKEEVSQAVEIVKQNVTASMGGARISMEERNKRTREGHAIAAEKVADKISQMDADELFMSAPLLAQHGKHASLVHGWNGNSSSLSIRMDIVNQCSEAGPVIDV